MGLATGGCQDWGLKHVSIDSDAAILDVGCGGGTTIHKLAAIATKGKSSMVQLGMAIVAIAISSTVTPADRMA
jgi:2-polyprenyl-3-methyl-5-hydroxy-6-metoxy-1,4-benzoquinol methylase